MIGEDTGAPRTFDEFLQRHLEALEQHADSDRPASWLTEAVLATADTASRGDHEERTR